MIELKREGKRDKQSMTLRRELIDELLKEYETLKAHPGRGWTAQRTDQSRD